MINIPEDAVADAQIESKLWLCRELERLPGLSNMIIGEKHRVWVYGGWVGMLSMLLLAREKFQIEHIRSYDLDPEATENANRLMENWVSKNWRFHAEVKDVNTILPEEFHNVDVIINCACEHMSMEWFERIPRGKIVVMQSTDMEAPDHTNRVSSLGEFIDKYSLLAVVYEGEKHFSYGGRHAFTRYMQIGFKS